MLHWMTRHQGHRLCKPYGCAFFAVGYGLFRARVAWFFNPFERMVVLRDEVWTLAVEHLFCECLLLEGRLRVLPVSDVLIDPSTKGLAFDLQLRLLDIEVRSNCYVRCLAVEL